MLKTVLIWKYMVQLTVLGIWLSDGAGVALLCLGGNIIGFVLVCSGARPSQAPMQR